MDVWAVHVKSGGSGSVAAPLLKRNSISNSGNIGLSSFNFKPMAMAMAMNNNHRISFNSGNAYQSIPHRADSRRNNSSVSNKLDQREFRTMACKNYQERFKYPTRKCSDQGHRVMRCKTYCCLGATNSTINLLPSKVTISGEPLHIFGVAIKEKLNMQMSPEVTSDFTRQLLLADLDPATAKTAIGILGPFLSAFAFLFILRIVMSWYPKLPVEKFPYVLAYAPTEPFLIFTRKVIPPLGGVDVTPVVWFGLVSFLNEILVGPQGLLVLISQQVS